MKIIWSKENFIIERVDVDEPVEEPKKPKELGRPRPLETEGNRRGHGRQSIHR